MIIDCIFISNLIKIRKNGKNIEYYESEIAEGSPAMIHAIFAILHARFDEPAKTFDALQEAHSPNKKIPLEYLQKQRAEPIHIFQQVLVDFCKVYSLVSVGST